MSDEHTHAQIPELSAGSYSVIVEAAMLKRAPTREPMIEYLFRIINDDQPGQRGCGRQIITPETFEHVMNNLNACGINCPAGEIADYLPRTRGVELNITISDDAARTVTFNRRLDNKTLVERGINEDVESFDMHIEKLCNAITAPPHEPRIKVVSIEDWDCHDSLLDELDPNFIVIEGEQ